MRSFLPKAEYKKIKNRKCARLGRLNRKTKTLNTEAECESLSQVNEKL